MADEKYDPYDGFYRVAIAAENLDMEMLEVVTLHLVLEREMEKVLATTLARVDNLSDLTFREKAIVLHATWPRPTEKAEKLHSVLKCFNSLRNDFAHGKSTKIDGHRRNLLAAYKAIDANAKEPITPAAIAQGICAFMGDGMMPDELKDFAEKLHEIVHVHLPAALGRVDRHQK